MPDGVTRPRIHYSQSWEDVAVARRALHIQPGGTVVAIGAAGDNVLALLAADPARILAVDINPAQTALVELKRAAFRYLGPMQIRAFLGGAAGSGAMAAYERLRPGLSPGAARYWDGRPDVIERGVIHAGRFERYLAAFRHWMLPIAPGRGVVREMLSAPDPAAQRRIFTDRWDSRRWRALFRIFFDRHLLAAFGRHPGAFTHARVEDPAQLFLERVRTGLTATPILRNPFVTYALTGDHRPPDAVPDYLRDDVIETIAARTARLEIRTQSLLDALQGLPAASVDAFYLSDVFELADLAEYEWALAEVARVGRPGARLCYWNNLVPRSRPARLAGSLVSHDDEAGELHRLDRAFLYSRLVVESVRPGASAHAA